MKTILFALGFLMASAYAAPKVTMEPVIDKNAKGVVQKQVAPTPPKSTAQQFPIPVKHVHPPARPAQPVPLLTKDADTGSQEVVGRFQRKYSEIPSTIGGEASVLSNSSEGLQLHGFGFDTVVQHELSHQVKLNVGLGYEHLGDGKVSSHDGARLKLKARYPAKENIDCEISGSYHTFGDFDFAGYAEIHEGNRTIQPGFQRAFVNDSYLSLVGKDVSQSISIGRARLYEVYSGFAWREDVLGWGITPGFGWVFADGAPNNFKARLMGYVALHMIDEQELSLTLQYKVSGVHFESDHTATDYSTFESYPSGYFSPRLLVEQIPGILINYRSSKNSNVAFEIGPSFQWAKEFLKDPVFEIGMRSGLSFTQEIEKILSLTGSVQYSKVLTQSSFGASLMTSYPF